MVTLSKITIVKVTLSTITLSIVTLSIVTLSIVTLSIVTLSIVTLSTITLRIIWLSIVTLSIVTLSMIPFCLGTLGNVTSVVNLRVIMLSVITDMCHHAECHGTGIRCLLKKKKNIDFNHLRDIYIGQMSSQTSLRKWQTYVFAFAPWAMQSVVNLSVIMLGVIMLIVMALSSDVCLPWKKTLISITSEVFTLAKCHCKNFRESKKLMYLPCLLVWCDKCCKTECHYVECQHTECHGTVIRCLPWKKHWFQSPQRYLHWPNVIAKMSEKAKNLCTPWAVQQVL